MAPAASCVFVSLYASSDGMMPGGWNGNERVRANRHTEPMTLADNEGGAAIKKSEAVETASAEGRKAKRR